jgi:integrase
MTRLDGWAPNELAAFVATAHGTRLEVAWCLMASAGLRAGELLALRWQDIDLDATQVEIRNAIAGVPYEVLAAPGASWARTVELEPDAIALLAEQRERQLLEQAGWAAEYREHGLVICREDGAPLHPRSLAWLFTSLASQAGLRPVSLAALRRAGNGSLAQRSVPA